MEEVFRLTWFGKGGEGGTNARSFRAALQSKGALCYDGGVDSSLRRAFGRGDGSMGQSET